MHLYNCKANSCITVTWYSGCKADVVRSHVSHVLSIDGCETSPDVSSASGMSLKYDWGDLK